MGGETKDGGEPTQACVISAVGMVSKTSAPPDSGAAPELTQKLRGHYGYYGIIGNYSASRNSGRETARIWRRKLSRRRRDGDVTWAEFLRLEKRYSLPVARVVHSLRSSVAKS